jgi:hypothetical protein
MVLGHRHGHLLLSGSLSREMCIELAPHPARVRERQLPYLRRALLALTIIYKDIGHRLVHQARLSRAPVAAAQGNQHRPRAGLRPAINGAAPRPAVVEAAAAAAAHRRGQGRTATPRAAAPHGVTQKRPGPAPAPGAQPPSKRQLNREFTRAAAVGGRQLFANIRMQQRTVTEFFRPVPRAAPVMPRKHARPPPSPS